MKRYIAIIRGAMLTAARAAGEAGVSTAELHTAGADAYPTASKGSLGHALSSLVTEGSLHGDGPMNNRRYYAARTRPLESALARLADRAAIYNTPPLRCAMKGPYIHRRVPSWEAS